MKKTILSSLTIIFFSGLAINAYAGDGFSVTETIDTEHLSPFTTYPSPTSIDSRITSDGRNWNGYRNIPIPATPPPIDEKVFQAQPDLMALTVAEEVTSTKSMANDEPDAASADTPDQSATNPDSTSNPQSSNSDSDPTRHVSEASETEEDPVKQSPAQ